MNVRTALRALPVLALSLWCSLGATAWAAPGIVLGEQKISANAGGFGGNLSANDRFGDSLAGVPDLDGDAIPEVAVGVPGRDEGLRNNVGAVWLIYLDAFGRARDELRIGDSSGGFGNGLAAGDEFGRSVASIGDLDGDGIAELVVGAPRDDDGAGDDNGAVWVLFLEPGGRVRSKQKIS